MLRLVFALTLLCPTLSNAQSLFELQGSNGVFVKRQIAGQSVKLKLSQAQILNATQLEIPLGEGLRIKAFFSKKSNDRGIQMWHGKILNDPFGRIIIATNSKDETDIAAEIMAGGRSYSLMNTFNGPALIETRAITEDDIAPPPSIQKNGAHANAVQITAKSSENFVDVMLAYTDAVVAFNPNAATVLTARMATVNGILEDSCASFRYRLVNLTQVTYAETGNFSTDLGCLYAWSDGCLDNLHTVRDANGADLIQLVLYQNSACGLAHTNSIGDFYDSKAASVVAILCGPDTMAHELAHNMGILHDRYQMNKTADEVDTTYGTGYGFVDLANKHYDIMGYPNHCQSLGFTCTRSFQFSSPFFRHNGVPFGIPNRSDAVAQMNENFGYIANFRQSLSSYAAGVGTSCQTGAKAKDVNCFIATAAYGSYMHPQVQFLRDFRDRVLLRYSLGRAFVNAYYAWSPRQAEWLRQNPQYKIFVRAGIFSLVFLLRNGIVFGALGILALLLWLGARRTRVHFLILGLLGATSSSPPARAEFSAQSIFREVITPNPSLRLELPPGGVISAGSRMGTSAKSTSGAKISASRSAIPVLIGGYGTGWFLDASMDVVDKETIKNSQAGIGVAKDTIERSAIALRTGWASESIGHYGLGYRTQKTDQKSIGKSTRQFVDLGWHGTWDEFQFAASAHYAQESGADLASTKWIEEEIAFGYAVNPLENRFLVEYSLHRSPSVLKRDGAGFTAYGEVMKHRLVTEWAAMDSFFSDFAFYLGQNQTQKLNNYISSYGETIVGARLGMTLMSGFLLSLNYELIQPGKKTGSKESQIEAAFTAIL